VGFANADGGRVVVGIYDGQVEGVDGNEKHLNDILQASINYTQPPIRLATQFLDCVDASGTSNRLLILDIEASESIHRNKRGECFLRVGDENRRLQAPEERELLYDKGDSHFDQTLVDGLTLNDLDTDAIRRYAQKMGKDEQRLLRARGLYVEKGEQQGVTHAGWLILGKEPPIWSYIRYIRHAGTTIETGTRSNVLDDVRIEGNIPQLIEQAKELLSERIGTVIRLAPSGRFERIPVLPEFAWLEAVVNAVTHRSYSLQGDGVRVRDFEDRLEVESPGRLPGLVRVQNIRNTRFSRNPHIARTLAEMTDYVREMNEGVERMYEEMRLYGLREPHFAVGESSVKVTLFKQPDEARHLRGLQTAAQLETLRERLGAAKLQELLSRMAVEKQMRPRQISELLGVSLPTVRKYMAGLEKVGLVRQQIRSSTDPTRLWTISEASFWDELST
jgi:ATP-dependent DNA helicase RecG